MGFAMLSKVHDHCNETGQLCDKKDNCVASRADFMMGSISGVASRVHVRARRPSSNIGRIGAAKSSNSSLSQETGCM